MEIRDYLRAIRRRLWLPLLLPLIAGAAVVGLIIRQPAQYQATATVIVPAVSGKGFSTSAIAQYVATYKDVLVSDPVVKKVSKDTGVPVNELTTGLSANTVSASSNIIEVTFDGTNRTKVTPVVKDAALTSLDALVAPQLSAAQAAQASAQKQLDTANKSLSDFTAETGLLIPDEDFKIKQGELSQLIVQLSQANLSGDTARANGLKAIIAQRQADLTALAPQVTRYQRLTDQKNTAVSVLDRASQQVADAQSLIDSNHSSSAVDVRDNGRISKVSSVVKYGAVAVGVALVLALGLIVLFELLRPTRRSLPATELMDEPEERHAMAVGAGSPALHFKEGH